MLELRTFTPAQAARISGVNVGLQRDWRRREILPKSGGHARFSIFEVAELMALKSLADRGLSPASFKGVAGKLGACILRHALLERTSYDGPADDYLSMDIEGLEWVRGSRIDLEDQIWAWRAQSLADGILKREGHFSISSDAFIQWAEGSFDFYRTLIEPFEVIDDTDPRMAGAIVIVSLRSLGKEFAKRAGVIVSVDPGLIANQQGLLGYRRVSSLLAEIRSPASSAGAKTA